MDKNTQETNRYNVYLKENTHRQGKAKAALLGLSFSEYVAKLIENDVKEQS